MAVAHPLTQSWRPAASRRLEGVPSRPEAMLHGLLQVACAMCFIGHGAWGVLTKAGWLPLYGALGISPSVAWKTMPFVGAVDITLGAAVLVFPCRALLGYMVLWTLFTALLRPWAGLGWWEFFERAGNYGPPLALLVAASQPSVRWFQRIEARPVRPAAVGRVAWVLRVSIALLLLGHGGFARIQEKRVLIDHWQSIGVPAGRVFLHWLGGIEMAVALAVCFWPSRFLLLGIGTWKIASELLYPISGRLRDTWEWVERGGDYLCPLALLAVLALLDRHTASDSVTAGRAVATPETAPTPYPSGLHR